MAHSVLDGQRTRRRWRWLVPLCAAACVLTALSPDGAAADPPQSGRHPKTPAVTAVEPTVVSATADRGDWAVSRTGAGLRLTWRSPAAIPITDARPEFRDGRRVLGFARLGADRRLLSLDLPAAAAVDPARLQVWLGLRRLDVAGAGMPAGPQVGLEPRELARRLQATAAAPAADPGTRGRYAVSSFDYSDDPVPWPGFRAPMEVLGHATLPVGVTHAPVVLFLHGRHSVCYGQGDTGRWPCAGQSKPIPSYLGYRYLQTVLASQGYATVSISANAVNGQDDNALDGGARARGLLVRHHLALLARWSADPTNLRWAGRLDLNRVVLVGHSRGGEGVNQAAIDRPTAAPYRIRGQVLLAPTDFGYQTASRLPTAVVLPYCDGDVGDLQGQRYVDTAPLLTGTDRALRSSVLLMGANHNFFNTEWTPATAVAPSWDDWGDQRDPVCGRKASPTRLSAAEQRRAAVTFVAAGVHVFLGDRVARSLPWLDSGRPVAVPQAGPAVALTASLGGNRRTVRLRDGAQLAGSASTCRAGQALTKRVRPRPLCGPPEYYREPHWTPADTSYAWTQPAYFASGVTDDAQLSWSQGGTQGGFRLRQPMDVRSAMLDLRVVIDPASGPVSVRVVLGSGNRTWAGAQRILMPLPGNSWVTALWGQTVRIDPADYAGHLDLRAIDSIQLRVTRGSGRLWLLDASRRAPGLAAVAGASLPRVRLGRVVQPEGSAASGGTAQLPFRILGTVTAPARFAVAIDEWTLGEQGPRPRFTTITVAPGQTHGTVPVAYEADDLDDLPRQVQQVWAVPKHGILTSGFAAPVAIIDDDPAPDVRLVPQNRRVRYGADLVFSLRLSKAVDYWVPNRVGAIRLPDLRPLRTSDVPRQWLLSQLGRAPDDVPLARVWHHGYLELAPGKTTATLVVPTRAHPQHLNTKWLTVRYQSKLLDARVQATVRVSAP